MNIRLFSYGGSGLKFLTNFLGEYVEVYGINHNPHCRPQDSDVLTVDKAILIYSDPRNAILSFFRRSEQYYSTLVECGDGVSWLNKELSHQGRKQTLPNRLSIDDFLENYEDVFELNNYFNEWLNFVPPKGHSIVFVKYERLCDVTDELMDFLNLDKNISDELRQKFVPRSSDYTQESEKNQQMLYDKYKDLIETQESLGPFFIKE